MKPGSEIPNSASVVDSLIKKHFAGSKGIVQALDRVAEVNGGQGPNYQQANEGLEIVLQALKKMREGKK